MTRSEFLTTCINNCNANLAKSNIVYPNGRMSHDVEREALETYTNELHDLCLTGLWHANGTFADFAN